MAQPPYLVKHWERGKPPEQAHGIRVYQEEATRVEPAGIFNRRVGLGRPTGRLVLRFLREPGAVVGFLNFSRAIDPTAAAVKGVIRRLRAEEAEQLDVIDAEIARLQELIVVQREQRKEVLREAWTRAHVVRLNEIQEQVRGLG